MRLFVSISAVLIVLSASFAVQARPLPIQETGWVSPEVSAAGTPSYCAALHNVGQIELPVSNAGTFVGDGYFVGNGIDCATGATIGPCIYPKGSGAAYAFSGALWIGAIVNGDTLVSVGHDGWQLARELNPLPGTNIIRKSTISIDPAERDGAISPQDFIVQYTDTFTAEVPHLQEDYIDHRPHVPLNVEITQRSYAWDLPVAEDFVVFSLSIKNVGLATLQETYVGILIDGDATELSTYTGYNDDIVGFRWVSLLDPSTPSSNCSSRPDSVPVAWMADDDGEFDDMVQLRGITGLTLLSAPVDLSSISFNWWLPNTNRSLDWGPRHKANPRDFGTGGKGTPEGDRNKYYLMRNSEIDFDGIFTASIDSTDSIWEPLELPSIIIDYMPDPRYLLSCGPFALAPGQEVPLIFAYVGGQNLHNDPSNLRRHLLNNYDPDLYMANLNFTDFENNVRAAAWLFDNPGIDTDGDGFAGDFVVCEGDTIRTTGDGVPDFVPVSGCCIGRTGNLDGDHSGMVSLADLSLLIAYLTVPGAKAQVSCTGEANVNSREGIDLGDLSMLISYLTVPGSVELPWCQ